MFTVTEDIKLYYLCDGVLISLLLFGRYLESVAIYQSGEAVRSLMRLQPKTAIVLRDGTEREIDAQEIVSGDTVVLRPGERVPADGVIIEGGCLVDESLLTGESEPVSKCAGDTRDGRNTQPQPPWVKARPFGRWPISCAAHRARRLRCSALPIK